MKLREFKKIVKKYNGWMENGIAYFPSVYLKEQAVAEMAKTNGARP